MRTRCKGYCWIFSKYEYMNQELYQTKKYQSGIDEIDLMDYVKIILKRKELIFGICFLAVAGAAVFSYYSPKIYEIDTCLEIGVIKNDGKEKAELVESPAQVIGKINNDAYGVLIREKLDISDAEFPKIKTKNPKNTNLVLINIESSETENAKNILQGINQLIITEHQKLSETKKELLKKEIDSLENKIQLSENDVQRENNKIKSVQADIQITMNKIEPLIADIERIEIKIDNTKDQEKILEDKIEALEEILIYEQTPGTQFALFDAKEKLANKKQEIENLYLRINSLRRNIEDYNIQVNNLRRIIEDYNSKINFLMVKIEDYNSQINSIKAAIENVKLTRVIKNPIVSEQPIKPKPLLNIIIAGILGLFMGTFLAFFREWWEKSK